MYRLEIQQCESVLGDWYEYKLTNLKTMQVIDKDSIDDIGQGIEEATKQIHNIINRRHGLNIRGE